MIPPGSHGRRKGRPRAMFQMPLLRIVTNQQNETQIPQLGENFLVPVLSAFLPRRQITPTIIQSGKTEPHRYNCYARNVVKFVTRHPHPIAQPISRGICKRRARSVHTCSRCLAAHANSSSLTDAKNRSGTVRKSSTQRILDANPTLANFGTQFS